MIIVTEELSPTVAVVRIRGNASFADLAARLIDLGRNGADRGIETLIIDAGELRGPTQELAAALTETACRLSGLVRIALIRLTGKLSAALAETGLSELATFAPDIDALKAHPTIRRGLLSGRRAVVLPPPGFSPGPGSAPCDPMLTDLLGKPVVEHLLSNLSDQGLRDVVFVLPGSRSALGSYLRQRPLSAQSILALEDSHPSMLSYPCDATTGAPFSLGRLSALQERFGLIRPGTLVIEGTGLFSADISTLLGLHASSGRPASRAIFAPEAAGAPGRHRGLLAILNPEAVEATSHAAADPAGIPLSGTWWSVATAGEWGNTALEMLRDQDRVTISPEARVGRGCSITGPCYIRPGASIGDGCVLRGPVVIGAGSVVEAKARLENCAVWPETLVRSGAVIRDIVASADWIAPLDGSAPVALRETPLSRPLNRRESSPRGAVVPLTGLRASIA